jgi:predicted ester cyclase
MSTERNKELVLRFIKEALNQRRLEVLDEILSPRYVNYGYQGTLQGEAFRAALRSLLGAFSDLHIEPEWVIAEGDKVATWGRIRGTHDGDFMGIAPTGRVVDISYHDSWRVEGDRLVENWVQMDGLSLLQQVGAIPAPQAAEGPQRKAA